jgi:hypothetical protein
MMSLHPFRHWLNRNPRHNLWNLQQPPNQNLKPALKRILRWFPLLVNHPGDRNRFQKRYLFLQKNPVILDRQANLPCRNRPCDPR